MILRGYKWTRVWTLGSKQHRKVSTSTLRTEPLDGDAVERLMKRYRETIG